MNNKRTITTREQFKINGEIRERTATHIVTGAHGYETLCLSGYIVEHNEMGEVIHNSEKLAEDLLPVTCPTCVSVQREPSGHNLKHPTKWCPPNK
ncbi:hypothetical protein [Klebsiella pneumoniae]|uniref:hypothetical protein n=1 Tax=Klebsiella pneumoniae TaxID=573 RepID=UPI003754D65C